MNITQEQPEENKEETLIDTMAKWRFTYEIAMAQLWELVEKELDNIEGSEEEKNKIRKIIKENK